MDPVDLTGVVDGVLVVVVRVAAGPGEVHYRRRVFLTLRSAERAVERSQARGQHAEIVLCRLAPVVSR